MCCDLLSFYHLCAKRNSYIWPKYHICEKTFYNIINASADPRIISRQEQMRAQLSLF